MTLLVKSIEALRTKLRRKDLFLFMSTILFTLSSHAASWKFKDFSTPKEPGGLCVISVEDSQAKTRYSLEIARAKGGIGPAEIFLRETKEASGAVSWMIDVGVESEQTLGFAELANDGSERLFWHLPVDTQSSVDQLLAEKALKITAVGMEKKISITFPRSGFAKAYQTLVDKCLNKSALVNSDFEAMFLKNVSVNGDLTQLSVEDVNKLRQLFNEGYETALAYGENNKKIESIVAKYKPTIDEYERVTSRIRDLEQNEIPGLRAGIEQQKVDRANAERLLRDTIAALPGLEQAVQRDQEVLDQARARRAPYEPENNRLEAILDDAEDDLRAAENRLRSIRSDLSETNRRLNEAERELSNLRSRLSYLERDVRNAESELRTARYERDRFDANAEIRRRTENSSTVRRLRDEATQARNEVHRLTRETEAAQTQLQRARQALQQCRSREGADCTAQQNAMNQAQSNYNSLNTQLQSAQRNVDSADRRLNQELAKISQEVRNEEARLNRRVDNAVDQLSRAQRAYDQAQYRIQSLQDHIIPDLERDIRDLEHDEVDARREVSNSEDSVRRADADLVRYRQSVNWSQLTERIRAAAQNLQRSTDARDTALRTKTEQERIIARTNQRQRELEQTLADREQELQQLKVREGQLVDTIARYRSERAPFDREANRLIQLLESQKVEYKQLIEA